MALAAENDLVYSVLLSANWLETNLRDLLKSHDITVQQYQVLKLVQDSDELVNHTYLKRNVVEKDADISRLLTRLEQMKLITKSSVSGDKRQSKIRLSKRGNDLMDKLNDIPGKMMLVFDGLDEDEQVQLKGLLNKMLY